MSDFIPTEGALKEGDIFTLLFHMYKHGISGVLKISAPQAEKQLIVEDRKIVFASSSLKSESLGDYLVRNHLINRDIYDRTLHYTQENGKRFGRALIELGFFHYEQVWKWIPEHLRSIVISFFRFKSGHYRLLLSQNREIENIVLNLDILDMMVEGIRQFQSAAFLEKTFLEFPQLFVYNTEIINRLQLKNYERHVFDLVKRHSQMASIIKHSELLEFDTLRILFLFLSVGAVGPDPENIRKMPPSLPEETSFSPGSFTSFDEALRYYNLKYELVYKTLCKEIGPIALSLLHKAVEDIMENLPVYFHKIVLTTEGKIEEESLLRPLWYYDFGKNVSAFLQGLEEILYAEMYVVRRHLGGAAEQQVLRWLNGIGN